MATFTQTKNWHQHKFHAVSCRDAYFCLSNSNFLFWVSVTIEVALIKCLQSTTFFIIDIILLSFCWLFLDSTQYSKSS